MAENKSILSKFSILSNIFNSHIHYLNVVYFLKKRKYYSFLDAAKQLRYFSNLVREIAGMSVEVNVESIGKGGKNVNYVATGNKLADQWNSSQIEETHIVKLHVESGDGTSFIFTHEVSPAVNFEESVISAQSALMKFATALQIRLNHPIR